ncbi:integrase [Paenibacillus endophyticus]|uniref:Integrase n=1 Tax=Paenibacillus endophyticus TaxID=1294268 RepID=A0A7W5G937_9BACL|nr:tyrosine-type recombinase/integrase [Paenibacillus endophyticus]MBB3151719.1 integrase [Paenibacillus endophyticus]
MASFKKYKTKTKGELWLFKIDVGKDPLTGERKTTTKRGFATKPEARLAAADIEREVANGLYTPDNNITFSEFAQEWLEDYGKSVKVSTLDLRSRMVDVLDKKLGALKVKDINRKLYQSILDDLGATYADNSLSIIHSTGKLIFKKAIQDEIIKRDPTEHTKVTRKKKTVEELEDEELPKFMEKEELASFLFAVKESMKHQDYTLFLMLAYTGMRIGELLALKWKDVSFEEHTVNITKTCYLPKHNTLNFILLPPKTKSSKREIVVDLLIISELKKHKFHQNTIKNHPASPFKDHDFIFTSERVLGYPYNKSTIEYKMKKALLISGNNQDLSPHSLRHSHCSLLAEAGVGLTEIMERLGHEDDQVTKRVYLHVTKTKRLDASNKFSALMEDAVKMRSKSNITNKMS